jgi:transcriptional regulator with GAF, ATPase, and Fis domain/pSer/pThr/pTyr-binding forkhead associated (FHA) protein
MGSAPSRSGNKPTANLIIQENGSERVYELKARSTTVGRSHENDIAIDDINSSRKHCQIERGPSGYEIVDLKSRNGTLVNGILVLRKELRPGDCIEIGKTRMFFDHVSSEFSEETIDLTTDHFLEPLNGLEGEDQLEILKKEREIFLKLLETNRTINSKTVLSDLLDLIVDTVVEVTGAERGFLLLADSGVTVTRSTVIVPAGAEEESAAAENRALSPTVDVMTPAPGTGPASPRAASTPSPTAASPTVSSPTVAAPPAAAPPAPQGNGGHIPATFSGKSTSSIIPKGEPELRVKAARTMDREPVKDPEVKVCRSIARIVLEAGKPVRSDDASKDRRFQGLIPASGRDQLTTKSVLCTPVRSGERVLGAIYVDNRFEAKAFSENHLRWLKILAEQVSVAIRNAQMFEDLRTRSKELEEARVRLERMNLDLENKVFSKSLQLEEVMKLIPRERPNRFKYDYSPIITRSPRMYEIFSLLDKVTDSVVPVLVLGESGTGKELIARAIHQNGPRKEHAFVSENCAAIPVNLLESEFFGHVRGAFTGASRDKRGLFEVADGGTLFLDEIADMSPAMQTKFLRVLQDGEIRRVGGKDIIKVDVRIISATNKNIYEMVRKNEFREDLLYRINVITITLPPLRDRREDIPVLIDYFLERIAQRSNEKKKTLDRDTFHLLYQYDWPGNIRELENEVERLSALGGERIEAHLLSTNIQAKGQDRQVSYSGKSLKDIVARTVEDVEKHVIRSTLIDASWKKTRASEILGISRPTLDAKIDKYGLTRDVEQNAPAEAAARETDSGAGGNPQNGGTQKN